MNSATPQAVTTIDGLPIYGFDTWQVTSMHGHVSEFFKKPISLPPGLTLFDVGANIGLFSLEVLKRTNGRATVYCFEPAPQIYAMLQANLEKRFPSATLHLHQEGVSSRASEAKFYFRPNSPAMSSIEQAPVELNVDQMLKAIAQPDLPDYYRNGIPSWFPRLPKFLQRAILRRKLRKAAQSAEVTCVLRRLSDAIREHNVQQIDLLKIDVENHEWEVLQGIDDEHWPRIKVLTVEVNNVDDRLTKIQELLARQGFDNVEVEQEIRFRGTQLYDLLATRSA